MKKTTTVLAGALMLAQLALAGVAEGSGRNPAGGLSHLQELTAMNSKYQEQVNLRAASRNSYVSHLADLTALNDKYQEQLVLASTTASRPERSFNWRDAGAGAGFAAVIGLLAAGAALMLRKRRVPAQPHP